MEYKITLTVKEDEKGNPITVSKITDTRGRNLKLTPRHIQSILVTLLRAFCNFVTTISNGQDVTDIKKDAITIIKKELK